jgi:RNA polymerase sigma-70 factor (ECF subfamily)
MKRERASGPLLLPPRIATADATRPWRGCHLLGVNSPCRGIVATVVVPVMAVGELEAVYRQDGDRLWRALYAFSGNEDVASDAVAEAFAQALRRGSAIRDVRSWVWRSAFSLAKGDLKRQSEFRFGAMPDAAFHDMHPDEQLLQALQGLTPQQRAVIVLHYYIDCPVREISRRTGINPLAVRAHLSRGRKRLRALLGDER